jgi:hypothetical protein
MKAQRRYPCATLLECSFARVPGGFCDGDGDAGRDAGADRSRR